MAARAVERHPVLRVVESMGIAHCAIDNTHSWAQFPQTLLCEGITEYGSNGWSCMTGDRFTRRIR